jgi:hypothetical protein
MFDVFYTGTPPKLFPHEKQVDSIEQAQQQSRTRYFWWINYLSDYSEFDFLWEPVPWESDQMHVWPSQHQANGGTALVPREYKHVNRSHLTVPRRISVPRLHIKHNPDSDNAGNINVRYVSDYLGVMRRVLSKTDWEYCWVTSDVCDYANFDFSWHPSEWQLDMLHVFASNEQKFGDTFYVHVPSFLEKIKNLKILEWFDTLHFVEDIKVHRAPPPQVKYNDDTVVRIIKKYEFQHPVVQFYRHTPSDDSPTVSLWQESTKTAMPLCTDNSTVIVPREVKNHMQQQVYDYPYINKKCKTWIKPEPQDIVFISYDEPDAEQNWQTLVERFPRAQRVHGVKGMETALEAAADLAQTPWYFAVFAKTRLYEQFDFSFVPDYMQQPKHYIFNARNTVNGLEYGHMGVIMYNSQGIRKINQTNDFGVDYTLSFAHESIPILSCYGEFDQTPYHTWRTAFREASKLAYFEHKQSTVDGAYRLKIWQTQAQGTYAEWCLRGANDGVEFFNTSDRELVTVKQAFRWEWLREYFAARYGNLE